MKTITLVLLVTSLFAKGAEYPKFEDGVKSFEKVKKELIKAGISEDQFYAAAIDGALQSMNPPGKDWNKLLSPSDLAALESDVKGNIAGIGVVISYDKTSGIATINDIVPNSPASKTKLRVGDQIISVNGKRFQSQPFKTIVYAIRGEVGTKVKLAVLRNEQVLNVEVTRQTVAWSAVETKLLDHSIGLIKLKYFTEQSDTEVKKALTKLHDQGVKAIIWDLRENQGGLLEKVWEVSSLIVPKGKTLGILIYPNGKQKKFLSTAATLSTPLPYAVLVNQETSSGAELFASILNEQLGATILGERTQGKWNVQTVDKLRNGYAVKYTISKFTSPNGKHYEATGLPPQIALDPKAPTDKENKDPFITAAVNWLTKS